ncbi:MAG TPA: HWE histidine kinase domain-containing protein [Allosphingosinicella sp.]|jgi:PAS domain S-box-containing protein|nr:HWE histidine kinase domain-containing protein [Allosphingosinicella sp.]
MASTHPQPRDTPGATLGPLIGGFDWASTPLGPIESWPDRLRFAAELCNAFSGAAAVYWGPELTLLYNEGFAELLRDRHPAAMGQPAREIWARIWDDVGPQFAQVLETGEGLSVAEWMIPRQRDGTPEESYWNYSLTPVLDADGRVAGIFTQREDVTRPVLAQRRLAFQVELADALRGLDDAEDVKRTAAALLGRYLGAIRVGFAELDEASNSVWISSEWVRDESIGSLARQWPLEQGLGPEALAYFRSGEVLALGDIRVLPVTVPERVRTWEELGVRALIAVPMLRDGQLKALLYVHEREPRDWKRSESAMARDVAERSWAAIERTRTEQSLRESEDHYRHAVELNPQVTWTALPNGVINRIAPQWEEWTGTSGLGGSWQAAMHAADVDMTLERWAHSLATAESYDVEHRIIRRDGTLRWARSRAYPRRGPDGAILLWYGATEDIHERKVAEEHQRLLINELNHRVKNNLATVQAIAFQTLKGDIPLAEAKARFEARLMALSRAHNLLTEQNWGGASLERVVRDSTEHLGGDQGRFALSGPPVWIAPRAALALALALHELGTNAAKYGALSHDGGRVDVNWRETEDGKLIVEWKERDGPPVAAPLRRGFGSRLIEQGLAGDLGGKAEIAFEPDGLRCTIEASLDAVRAEPLDG